MSTDTVPQRCGHGDGEIDMSKPERQLPQHERRFPNRIGHYESDEGVNAVAKLRHMLGLSDSAIGRMAYRALFAQYGIPLEQPAQSMNGQHHQPDE